MANSILARLAVLISANTAELNKGLNSAQKELTGFSKSVKDIAAGVGLAFSATAIANFTLEVAKLAGEAEGVRAAFERLPQSEKLMSQLKEATAGTVSELELMKRTVQATNFGIDLESLPKLLEFAAIRAQQTGQSVDYLVDSIVTGIGRKSPLILDNLGISAVRLKEKFGGAALEAQSIGDVAKAVGKIAEEELVKMGDLSENTSTKIQRLSASWEDLKVAMGNAANSSGVIQKSLNQFTNFFNVLAGDELTRGINQLQSNVSHTSEILEQFAAAGGKIDLSWQDILARGLAGNEAGARKLEERLAAITLEQKNLATANNAVAASIDPLTGVGNDGVLWKPEVVVKEIVTLESLRLKINELNTQFAQTDINDQQKLANTGALIVATNKQIEGLEKLRKEQEAINQLSAFGKQQLADAVTRSTGDVPAAQVPIEFKFGEGDDRSFENIFPTTAKLSADTGILFNNLQMATGAVIALRDAYGELGGQAIPTTESLIEHQILQIQKQQEQIAAAEEFGSAFGSIIGNAIRAEEGFVGSMKKITKELLKLFLVRALGAAISKSFESAKNPIVGAALAAASTAVVSAMFSKIGGPSKSVGGGSVGGSSAATSRRIGDAPPAGNRILFDGEIKMTAQGNQLVAVLNNQTLKSERTG